MPLFKAGDQSLFLIIDLFLFYLPFPKYWKKRLVYNRLFHYLSDLKILCNNQFGFRKRHSPEHVLALLSDKIYSSIDSDEAVAGIFIDLPKALDTVNHQIL